MHWAALVTSRPILILTMLFNREIKESPWDLYPHQNNDIQAINKALDIHRSIMYQLPTGGGKCHGKGTKVLNHLMRPINVEDIKPGDKLLGDDNTLRTVKTVCTGREKLYKIIPKRGGDPFTINESHILSFVANANTKLFRKGGIYDICFKEWLKLNKTEKHILKLYRGTYHVSNSNIALKIPPYILGVWLGDGTEKKPSITNGNPIIIDEINNYANSNGLQIRVTYKSDTSITHHIKNDNGKNHFTKALRDYGILGNKRIPQDYFLASEDQKLELLAGILDTDGFIHRNGFEITQKRHDLFDDIIRLARSCGFKCSWAYKKVHHYYKGKRVEDGIYKRGSITGSVEVIPNKLKIVNSTRPNKSSLRTGFDFEDLGIGDYYGFEIDGNRRYLLGDFTVTHNTVIFNEIAKEFVKSKKRVLVLAHRKELILQAYNKLLDWYNINSGIIMAGFVPDYRYPVQVASVQTLNLRDKPKNIDLIIVDEAHRTTAKSYLNIINCYPNAKLLCVTATPWRLSGKGFTNVVNHLICGPSIKWLEQNKFLVPAKPYVNPLDNNSLSKVKITGGDYNEKQLAEMLANGEITAGLVSSWKSKALGRKTIVFAVNVEHSIAIKNKFIDEGIPAVQVDGTTPKQIRERYFKDFEKGIYTVLVNVGIATEGYDCPAITCVQLARPTKSLSLYLQMAGRGSRKFPGKEEYILLDNANCILEHGLPNRDRNWSIKDRVKKKRNTGVIKQFKMKLKDGTERIVSSANIPQGVGEIELVELKEDIRVSIFNQFVKVGAKKGYNKAWPFYKFLEKVDNEPTMMELRYIGSQLGYKPAWATFKFKELAERRKLVR